MGLERIESNCITCSKWGNPSFFLGPEFVYAAEFIVFHPQIVAETITEVGDPKEAICKAVEKLNIQFLVLGSHGRGAFGR